MNVHGPIATIIAANSAATAIMGGRVYPAIIKQEAGYPAASVMLVSGQGNQSKSGVSTDDNYVVQIDIYGTTFKQVHDAGDAIRTALDYYSGTVTPSGGTATKVDLIYFITPRDGFADDPAIHRLICEYGIRIKRV